MKNLLKILWPISISSAFSILFLVILRTYFQYEGITADLSAWGVFFSVFGVLYAIVAGFLVIEVLQRFTALQGILEEELNNIEDIRDYLNFMDGQLKAVSKVYKALYVYVKSILDKEWPAMAKAEVTDSDTPAELFQLMNAIHQLRVTNKSDDVALQGLMSETFEITTLRTKRIDLANRSLPANLFILLIFMSVVLVIGISLLGVSSFWVHLIMVVAITFSIHLVYIVISDLNSPFYGSWNLSKENLERLEEKLKKLV